VQSGIAKRTADTDDDERSTRARSRELWTRRSTVTATMPLASARSARVSGSLPLDADRRATKRCDEDFQKAGRHGHRRPGTRQLPYTLCHPLLAGSV